MTSPKEPEEEWVESHMKVVAEIILDWVVVITSGGTEYKEAHNKIKEVLYQVKSQGAREALEGVIKEVKKEMAEPYDGEFSPEDAFSIVLSILQSNLKKKI